MKKGLAIIGVAVAAIAAYFFFNASGEKKEEEPRQQALTQSSNNDAFNKPFGEMLNSYFALQTALVDWDTAKASAAADTLAVLMGKVPYDALKADTTIIATAKSFSENITADAQGLAGDNSIEEKRHSFYTLSENLYSLIRTVHYDQQVIYHDKCPMAFKDSEEAYWITNSKEIINPYLGKKHPMYKSGMIGCGSIEDSIDYRTAK
ncbi:MAG TPA: DUF3347 domain-containing protein [Panacibacter sp.]|nr:DUF3347 domain-containing protein [Panacibacter sp.]